MEIEQATGHVPGARPGARATSTCSTASTSSAARPSSASTPSTTSGSGCAAPSSRRRCESTLVHELTHALQDQYFDVGTRFDLLRDDEAATSAYQALVEGDARRIEAGWREELGKKARRTLDKDMAAVSSEAADRRCRCPRGADDDDGCAVRARLDSMLQLAVARGGDAAVDELFRVPPSTEEHELDPWTLLEDHQTAKPVREPRLTPRDEKVETGPFGALAWLAVLGQRLPARQALVAAARAGWRLLRALPARGHHVREGQLRRRHRPGPPRDGVGPGTPGWPVDRRASPGSGRRACWSSSSPATPVPTPRRPAPAAPAPPSGSRSRAPSCRST